MEAAIRVIKETGADAVKLEGGARNHASIRTMVECRDSGHGTPRAHAAVRASDERLPRAGTRRRGGSPDRGGEGARGGGLLRDRARERSGDAGREGQRGHRDSDDRDRRRARAATARSSCSTTCSASTRSSSRSFVKRYAKLAETIEEAVRAYAREVEEGAFPGPEHSFGEGKSEGEGVKTARTPDAARAVVRACRARGRDGRFRADDGRAPRGHRLLDASRPAGVRPPRGEHLRQPAPVRAEGEDYTRYPRPIAPRSRHPARGRGAICSTCPDARAALPAGLRRRA